MLTSFGFVFYFAIYPALKNEDTIAVPDIIGMSEDNAIKILDDNKINYEIVYQEGNTNSVLKTVPEAYALIKESQKVIVYVEYQEDRRINDLTGYSYDDALKILKEYKNEYGIEFEIKYKELEAGIDNIVISQSDVSSFLKDIDHIEITISLVNNTVTVPNFNGKSYLEALNFCNKNGFVLEAIFIPSSLDRNTIIYQEIEPNSILYKNSGTRLTFYVAK